MTRRWAWPVWRAWLVAVMPLLAVLWLASFLVPAPLIAIFAWWLKPLYERIPLFVLSRSLFGATPSAGQVLRAAPGHYWHRLVPTLTLLRPDPARSFLLSVSLLERLGGRAHSRRRSLLSHGQLGAAMWLTFTCLLMELAVLVGLLGMVALLLPDAPQWHPLTLIDQPGTWRVILALWMLALSLVEPLFAGGGFGLYLNRRTCLEGWDVELVFRSLAQRLSASRVAALAFLLLLPGLARADTGLEFGSEAVESEHVEPPEAPFELDRAESETARKAGEEVLARDDFGHTELLPSWRIQEQWAQRLEDIWPDGCVDEPEQSAPPSALSPIIAQLLEVTFWVLGALGVIALAVVLVRSRFVRDLAVDIELPEPLMGESTLDQDLLPPSLADEARRLLRRGEVERALGLLYKGSVLHLVQVGGLPIEEGATEGEVLRIVRRKARPRSDYFGGLTQAWLEVAYAHRRVEPSRVSALIDEWPHHFSGGA